jgi:hypothetical protein
MTARPDRVVAPANLPQEQEMLWVQLFQSSSSIIQKKNNLAQVQLCIFFKKITTMHGNYPMYLYIKKLLSM